MFTVRVGNLKPRQAATIRLTYVCPLERVDKSDPRRVPDDRRAALRHRHRHRPARGDDRRRRGQPAARAARAVRADAWRSRSTSGGELAASTRRATRSASRRRGDGRALRHARRRRHGDEPRRRADARPGEGARADACRSARGPDGRVVPRRHVRAGVRRGRAGRARRRRRRCSCSTAPARCRATRSRQATAALELCLRSLSPGDTFNVCRFGSTLRADGERAAAVLAGDARPRARATSAQAADLGGTELYAPLEAILDGRRRGRGRSGRSSC